MKKMLSRTLVAATWLLMTGSFAMADEFTGDDLMKFAGTYEMTGKCAKNSKRLAERGSHFDNTKYDNRVVITPDVYDLHIDGFGISETLKTDDRNYGASGIGSPSLFLAGYRVDRNFDKANMKIVSKESGAAVFPPQVVDRHRILQIRDNGELFMRVPIEGLSAFKEEECFLKKVAPHSFQEQAKKVFIRMREMDTQRRAGYSSSGYNPENNLRVYLGNIFSGTTDEKVKADIAASLAILNQASPETLAANKAAEAVRRTDDSKQAEASAASAAQ